MKWRLSKNGLFFFLFCVFCMIAQGFSLKMHFCYTKANFHIVSIRLLELKVLKTIGLGPFAGEHMIKPMCVCFFNKLGLERVGIVRSKYFDVFDFGYVLLCVDPLPHLLKYVRLQQHRMDEGCNVVLAKSANKKKIVVSNCFECFCKFTCSEQCLYVFD